MAQNPNHVKGRRDRVVVIVLERCRTFFDRHPRTGWWISFWLFLNYLLDIVPWFF